MPNVPHSRRTVATRATLLVHLGDLGLDLDGLRGRRPASQDPDPLGVALDQPVARHLVVVLGDPEYYTRFGFVPASRYGLRCEWDVPDESFMVHVLDPAATGAAAGLIRYRPEFVMEMPG